MIGTKYDTAKYVNKYVSKIFKNIYNLKYLSKHISKIFKEKVYTKL